MTDRLTTDNVDLEITGDLTADAADAVDAIAELLIQFSQADERLDDPDPNSYRTTLGE